MEFGQDAANNALVILETAVGWWLVRNWKGSSSQLWAEAELWLRGFSLTTTFGDTGAFLRGLLFNCWYHQLLLGFWSYTDSYSCHSCRKFILSVWNPFPMDMNRWSCLPIWLRGFLDRGRGFLRDFLLKQNEKKALLVSFMACTQLTCLVDWFFF